MTTIDEHKAQLAQSLSEAARKAAPPHDPDLTQQPMGFLPAFGIWGLIAGPLIDTFAQMLKEAIEEQARKEAGK